MLNISKNALSEIIRRTKAGAASLYLDFDGTLAPIVPEPSDARLDDHARSALCRILAKNRITVGIISGRLLEDLRTRVGIDGIVYAGNHGLEIAGKGLMFVESTAHAAMAELQKVVKQLLKSLWHIPGVRIEDKQLTATVHFRLVTPAHLEKIRDTVEQITAPHAAILRVRSAKESIDVLPRTDWDKGEAVLWINRRLGIPDRAAIYAGENATDEDAFKALKRGVTIQVGRRDSASARYSVGGPVELRQLLEAIALNTQ